MTRKVLLIIKLFIFMKKSVSKALESILTAVTPGMKQSFLGLLEILPANLLFQTKGEIQGQVSFEFHENNE